MPLFGAKTAAGMKAAQVTGKPQPPAPRGYYRGPLPLPGRKPVSLNAYRGAALRATKIKHRDQARDKYVLARNRRAQVLAGTVVPQVPYPEALPAPPAYPAIEYPGYSPVYEQAPIVAPADYGYAAPVDYGYSAPIVAPADYGYAAPVDYGYAAPVDYGFAAPVYDGGFSAVAPSYSAGYAAAPVGYSPYGASAGFPIAGIAY